MTDDELTLDLDIDSMTLGEMEIVEDLTGLGLDEIGDAMTKPGPKTKVLVALAYVVKRRTDPTVTVEQVKGMRVSLAASDPKDVPAIDGQPGSVQPPVSLSVVSGVI